MLNRLVGIIPLVMGLAMLWEAWGSSDSFHTPPLIFQIFESCFASILLLLGGSALLGRLKTASPVERLKALQEELREAGHTETPAANEPPARGKLKCPNCGSSPGQAEVSPHGDVKCDHCSRWYNVHTA